MGNPNRVQADIDSAENHIESANYANISQQVGRQDSITAGLLNASMLASSNVYGPRVCYSAVVC